MRRFLGVVVACSALVSALAGEQQPQSIYKTFRTNNGFGVASVAGITSRNGRVSSISGVNFFPSGTDPFDFATSTGEKIPQPLKFTKEEDGRISVGEIKYGPGGSVSVSSIARSVFPEDSTKVKSAMRTPDGTYKANDFKSADMIFQDPFAAFSSRSLNGWYPFMFRQPSFQNINAGRSAWPYPNFNPLFNYWRR